MSLCTGMGIASASSCTSSRVVDQHWTVFLYCEATVMCWNTDVSVSCSGWLTTSCIKHNFQRRMSRLEQRWRAQRSVISIVNCRIPWTNRDLNVYCAFGISLKACLLQCLLILMPLTYCTFLVLSCVRVCVSMSFVLLTHSVHRCWPQQAIWITLLCHTLLCCWFCAWYNSNYLISFKTWS